MGRGGAAARSLGSQRTGALRTGSGVSGASCCCCPLLPWLPVSWGHCGGGGKGTSSWEGECALIYLFLHSCLTSVCPKNMLPFCLSVNSVSGVLLYTVSCVALYASSLFLCCGRCSVNCDVSLYSHVAGHSGRSQCPLTIHSVPPPPPNLGVPTAHLRATSQLRSQGPARRPPLHCPTAPAPATEPQPTADSRTARLFPELLSAPSTILSNVRVLFH